VPGACRPGQAVRPANGGDLVLRRRLVPGQPAGPGPSAAATCPRQTPPPRRTHVAVLPGQARRVARAHRPGHARNRVRCPAGRAVASATHLRPGPQFCDRGQLRAGRLREPRGHAARQGARPHGNRVPRRAATAGWRCPARRASLPAVPARASARTWDRRAGQTCPPALGLSRAGYRFRARTPVRSGCRGLGHGLDRRGEPGGSRWRDRQGRGREVRTAERKPRDRRSARAGGLGQVPCADHPRDQDQLRDQDQPPGRNRHGDRSRCAGPAPGRGARLRLRCRTGLPRRGTGPRPGCGLEWADPSPASPDSSRRQDRGSGPATNPRRHPGEGHRHQPFAGPGPRPREGHRYAPSADPGPRPGADQCHPPSAGRGSRAGHGFPGHRSGLARRSAEVDRSSPGHRPDPGHGPGSGHEQGAGHRSGPDRRGHGPVADHGPAVDHGPVASHRDQGRPHRPVPSNGPLPDVVPQDAALRAVGPRHGAARESSRSGGPHDRCRDLGHGRKHGRSQCRGHAR
jgi:hypothetical protein